MATATTQRIPTVARMLREIATPEGFERDVRTETTYWGNEERTHQVLAFTSPDVTIEINFVNQNDPLRRDGYMLADGHVTFETSAGQRTFDRYGVEDSFYIDNPLRRSDRDRIWTEERVVSKGGHLGIVTLMPGYRSFGEDRKDSFEDKYLIAWDGVYQVEELTEAQLKRKGIKRADVVEQTNARIRRFLEVEIPEARALVDRSERIPGIPFSVTPEKKERVIETLKAQRPYRFMPSGFGIGYTLETGKTGWNKRAAAETETFFGISPLYVDTFDAD